MRALHSLCAATTASLPPLPLLLVVISLLLAGAARVDGEHTKAVEATAAAAAAANSPNITAVTRRRGAVGPNSTAASSMHILGVSLDASVLRRAAYFCLGVVAVLGFFAALRMRRRFRKPRKYGVIVTPADEVEMDPLADDLGDEDEDMTLFEAKRQR